MGKRHIPENHTAHPNVTPLIDVVMCLIIFFILVAKIGVNTGAEAMDIPESVWGSDLKTMSGTLVLNVRPGPGELPMITALVKNAQGVETKTELKLGDGAGPNQLKDVLKYYRDKEGDKFAVIIRGDAEMAYRYLEPVLDACAAANVRNVDFNTKKVTEKAAG